MAFNEKDLDELLWEWASETLKGHDSGYPSNYILEQRVDHGTPFVPNYYSHPKVCFLGNAILSLELSLKNALVAKYLFCWRIAKIALFCECHPATVYRKLSDSRGILLAEMRNFVYNSNRM